MTSLPEPCDPVHPAAQPAAAAPRPAAARPVQPPRAPSASAEPDLSEEPRPSGTPGQADPGPAQPDPTRLHLAEVEPVEPAEPAADLTPSSARPAPPSRGGSPGPSGGRASREGGRRKRRGRPGRPGRSPRREPETVVRLSGPASLVAAVPHLVGFEPAESVVVLAMRQSETGRSRVVLTERVDLPAVLRDAVRYEQLDDEEAELGEQLAQLLADRAAAAGASTCVVLVWTGTARAGEALPYRVLVEQLADALAAADAPMVDALAVGPTSWWSYVCEDVGCCPSAGRERPALDSGPFAAASALAGRSLLPDRAALVRSVARVDGMELDRQQQVRDAVRDELGTRVLAAQNASFLRWQTLNLWDEWLITLPERRVVPDEVAAQLSIGLEDVLTRDAVVCRVLTDEDEVVDDAIALLLAVVPRALPPEDSACTTLLAWFAYSRGDGALANVCLDRVLAGDPTYSMARLLRDGVDRGAEPQLLREAARDSAALVQQLLAG